MQMTFEAAPSKLAQCGVICRITDFLLSRLNLLADMTIFGTESSFACCAGLIGSVPEMPYASAMKFFAFDNVATGLSQPCSINSPKWGGSSKAIDVQALSSSLHKYQECLPSFLLFDIATTNRQPYTDSITCPMVTWIKPNASTGVRFTLRFSCSR